MKKTTEIITIERIYNKITRNKWIILLQFITKTSKLKKKISKKKKLCKDKVFSKETQNGQTIRLKQRKIDYNNIKLTKNYYLCSKKKNRKE